jgi:hypothetical protein
VATSADAGMTTKEAAIDWVIVASGMLVLALVGLGFLALFDGWLPPG